MEQFKPVIKDATTAAAAKKQQAEVARVKAKERRRARAQAQEQPRKKFRDGEVVNITGSAKVNDDDVHGNRVRTDHRGARAHIGTSYFSPERQEHVHVTCTEDGEIRAVPESHLSRPKARHASSSMAGTYAPGQYEQIFGHRPKLNVMEDHQE